MVITKERVRQILSITSTLPVAVQSDENIFRWKWYGTQIDQTRRKEILEELAVEFLKCADSVDRHILSLDELLCQQLSWQLDATTEPGVQATYELLSRLPACAPKVNFNMYQWGDDNTRTPWPGDYLVPAVAENARPVTHAPWEELQAVSTMSAATIQLAAMVSKIGRGRYSAATQIKQWIDFLSELLDAADNCSSYAPENQQASYVLMAYLWSTWQRSVMLFFCHVLENPLSGYEKEWNELLAIRGPSLLSHRSISATLNGWANVNSSYMCAWAFELLRSSRSSIGLDFRRFHKLIKEVHGSKTARCTIDEDVCDGSDPTNCGRFTSRELVAGDQLVHDSGCEGHCKRLTWDRSSYLRVRGGRAVSLASTTDKITYCQASEDTFAISHVWSHGQGGRPSTGINRCLHRRYVRLAQKHDCKSYWLDTVCIPDEHDLRREAIMSINTIFSDSRVTLICDRDMMSMSSPSSITDVVGMERLIVTLLVCDWNVRAWTMLESIRGDHNLHILCASDEVVSVNIMISTVLHHGALDIATLTLAAQHLLASNVDGFRKSSTRKSIEEASNLLSHRYATRPGDDIVIWSLLSSISVHFDPLGLWKSKVGARMNTGFLMSSAPRLEARGFSWAPCSPNVRSSDLQPTGGQHFSYEGAGSEVGLIGKKGFTAYWLFYEVRLDDAQIYAQRPTTITFRSITDQSTTLTLPGPTINACWKSVIALFKHHKRVCILQPKSVADSRRYVAAKNRSVTRFTVIAVCFSNDEEDPDDELNERWTWDGVHTWENGFDLPPMIPREVLLV